jgi:hypothetical protein
MHIESASVERVEIFVRHSVFKGSDEPSDTVLDELESMAETSHISRATYQRSRELILSSPHFSRGH